jgi:hypothetical protein
MSKAKKVFVRERVAPKNIKRLNLEKVEPLINIAVQEDFGYGDPTSEITVDANARARVPGVARGDRRQRDAVG